MRGHPATVSGLLLLPLLIGMTLGNRLTAVADLRGDHGEPARSTGADRLTAATAAVLAPDAATSPTLTSMRMPLVGHCTSPARRTVRSRRVRPGRSRRSAYGHGRPPGGPGRGAASQRAEHEATDGLGQGTLGHLSRRGRPRSEWAAARDTVRNVAMGTAPDASVGQRAVPKSCVQ
ncbi:hypothetical protein [Streptomyces avermitilis]|uniref:hypothetical protein n=1 Tax=Streptomyces avermitilis TaxID=33903 RepID=UPI0036C086D8